MSKKIYVIRSKNSELFYIGSTIQRLCERFGTHRHMYKKGITSVSSHKVIENGDSYIELIEEFKTIAVDELKKKEGELVKNYKKINDNCVNINIAGRTRNEYFCENKIEIIKQLKKKILCECGCSVSYRNMMRHKKIHKNHKV